MMKVGFFLSLFNVTFFLKGKSLAGLVMEAPFLNIHQALLTHWFSLVNNLFKIIYLFIKNNFV